MVLEKLGESLKNTLQKLTKSLFINDTILNEIIKDIQKALLQSDVNVKLVFQLTQNIKERAKQEELPPGLSKKEQLITIVYEELTKFLGGEQELYSIKTTKKPYIIMLVGLFGNGKTTVAGKLGKYLAKRGYKVATVGTDTWRPAAGDQLKTNAQRAGIDFYGEQIDKTRKGDITYAVDIFKKHSKEYKKYDVLIVDTAGRDALSEDLIAELNSLNKAVQADDIFLVMGADVGQTAEKQAAAFHEACGVTGVIISKMDGTAKGGGALSACAITKAPVRFIGVGEHLEDFEEFKPKNFVGRLLGMGDLESLLEKAKEAFSQKDSEDMTEKFTSGNFTLEDLYNQMMAMKKMGPLTKVMELIPGAGSLNIPKEVLKEQEGKLEYWKFIMNSCTKKELNDPDLIDSGRIARIAKGSGRTEAEVRDLLKHYKQSKKMIKTFMQQGGKGKNAEKMMRRMGGLKGLGLGQ
jgi:signal recognition particle subunit SRP54